MQRHTHPVRPDEVVSCESKHSARLAIGLHRIDYNHLLPLSQHIQQISTGRPAVNQLHIVRQVHFLHLLYHTHAHALVTEQNIAYT